MATSRIRHPASRRLSDARNSSADEKARTAYPNSLSKSGSDSRTDSSSSMTATRGRSSLMLSPLRRSPRLPMVYYDQKDYAGQPLYVRIGENRTLIFA